MTRLRLLALLVLTLTGCTDRPDSAPAGPPAPAVESTAVAFPALADVAAPRAAQLDLRALVGTLVREGRCLRLVPAPDSPEAVPGGARSALVIWPEGATLDGDTVRSLPPGNAVAIGGTVVLTGLSRGWYPRAGVLGLGVTELPPEACDGPYWVVGTVLDSTTTLVNRPSTRAAE